MFIIEYRAPSAEGLASFHSELALSSTAEEAMDHANRRLTKLAEKYGIESFRIIDSERRCIGIGPEGFFSPPPLVLHGVSNGLPG